MRRDSDSRAERTARFFSLYFFPFYIDILLWAPLVTAYAFLSTSFSRSLLMLSCSLMLSHMCSLYLKAALLLYIHLSLSLSLYLASPPPLPPLSPIPPLFPCGFILYVCPLNCRARVHHLRHLIPAKSK